jgi:zinc transport system substrate-binding protein
MSHAIDARALLTLLLSLALALPLPAAAEGRLTVYTVNYPLYYFAQRIGGDHVEVRFPAPPGRDPAFWMPPIAVLGEYQQADLILLNGASYAQWLDKVSLPRSRLVDTSRAFAADYIPVVDAVTHSHGPEGEHSHTGTASTTWLDLRQASQQAQAIADALVRRLPAQRDEIRRNLGGLQQDLAALDADLARLETDGKISGLLASHPRYQYLARRYGLEIRSVQWEPGQMPTADQWAEIESLLRESPASWMLWEAEPNPPTVSRLEALGVASLVFDPAAGWPSGGDFISIMRDNIERLQLALRGEWSMGR